jgi:molecular chaperone DnaJ
MSDPYAVLGVSRSASNDDIKSAYRKLARKYHPDVNPNDPTAEEKFKEVSQAYSVLGDPERRESFDRFGTADTGGGGAPGDFFQGADFGDIFEAFFGGMGGQRGRRGTARDGEDLRAELELSLLDVLTGGDKLVTYRRMKRCSACGGSGGKEGTKPDTCPDCRGSGSVTRIQQTLIGSVRTTTACPKCHGTGEIITDPCPECKGRKLERVEETITVTVPAGVEDGSTLRVQARGSDGTGGGIAGDLYVVLSVGEDDRFLRDGVSLYTVIELTYAQAVLGDTIQVEGLNGPLELDIDAGTHPGQEFRIKGQGLPRLHGGSRGDLIIQATISVPRKVTEDQERLLREFAESAGETSPKGQRASGFLGSLFKKKR